jgi:hypothetical protein
MQLVVSQPRLLQQVLLRKMQYLQAGPDYCHGRGTEDAGNIYQSTFGGRLLPRPCSRCLLHSNGGRRSALLRSCSHHLFNGGGYGLRAPLWSMGLAPRAPRRWGMDYDFQRAPPLCSAHLCRPPRRTPLAAPPAYKEDYSSASILAQ